jgi:hypothetical protein
MKVVALKLTSGREVIGLTSLHSVEFGIKPYPGKIPRKVFYVQETKADATSAVHTLELKSVMELMQIAGQLTIQGFFGSSTVEMTPKLMFHSNDCIALNTLITPQLDVIYRKNAGLITALPQPEGTH